MHYEHQIRINEKGWLVISEDNRNYSNQNREPSMLMFSNIIPIGDTAQNRELGLVGNKKLDSMSVRMGTQSGGNYFFIKREEAEAIRDFLSAELLVEKNKSVLLEVKNFLTSISASGVIWESVMTNMGTIQFVFRKTLPDGEVIESMAEIELGIINKVNVVGTIFNALERLGELEQKELEKIK